MTKRGFYIILSLKCISTTGLYFSSFRLTAALNNEGFFVCNFIANIITSIKYIHWRAMYLNAKGTESFNAIQWWPLY